MNQQAGVVFPSRVWIKHNVGDPPDAFDEPREDIETCAYLSVQECQAVRLATIEMAARVAVRYAVLQGSLDDGCTAGEKIAKRLREIAKLIEGGMEIIDS